MILKKYYLTLAWAVVIMVLCLLPGSSFPKEPFIIFPQIDKVVHVSMFFILATLMANEYRLYEKPRISFYILLIICTTYGFTTEICQLLFTTSRHFEWMDGFSDGMGSLTGLLLSYRFHARNLHR